MASPKKVNSVKLTATTLSDPDLPLAKFNKADLISLLNTVTSSEVVIYIDGEGTDNGTVNKMIIAGLETNGSPSSSKQLPSTNLPCPPFCSE